MNYLKIVYSDKKSGRTAQVELDKDKSALLLNMKIGDTIEGNIVGLPGFKLKITGGSDRSGFPLDRSIQGTIKTKAFRSMGNSGKSKGILKRKTVRGNMVSQDVEQLNTVITEYGPKSIDEIFPKKEKQEKKGEEKK